MAQVPQANVIYDRIGVGYAAARIPDPHIEAQIHDAIGNAASVINVGAGTGNYEPTDRRVIAVEPSSEMLVQRAGPNPAIQGIAEALPFPDASFDCSLCLLTIHHWPNRSLGLRELRRVAERHVAWVYDTDVSNAYWLAEYFPSIKTAAWEVDAPRPEHVAEVLTVTDVRPIMVPADCSDGFSGAYWNRPERYLEPTVQAGMSTLARLPDAERHAGSAALRAAIESGEWDERHGYLRQRESFDIGYRLVLATS